MSDEIIKEESVEVLPETINEEIVAEEVVENDASIPTEKEDCTNCHATGLETPVKLCEKCHGYGQIVVEDKEE